VPEVNLVPDVLRITLGINQLLVRVAKKLCNCGTHTVSVEYHSPECVYRKLIEDRE